MKTQFGPAVTCSLKQDKGVTGNFKVFATKTGEVFHDKKSESGGFIDQPKFVQIVTALEAMGVPRLTNAPDPATAQLSPGLLQQLFAPMFVMFLVIGGKYLFDTYYA
eukprot:TRINITY_DN112443_c0_g1_i1.p1 TRINITY_DN112443_c0_g1~~TRINITY_DN112443_c0_g1_i1.p1  ORF type:complete len:107 (+),score=11.50 TRINITY_DN112443_c0_g1_i1:113-433(+)